MIHVSEPNDFAGVWFKNDWEPISRLLPEGTQVKTAEIPDERFRSAAVQEVALLLGDGAELGNCYEVCVLELDDSAPGGWSWRILTLSADGFVYVIENRLVTDVPGTDGDGADGVLRAMSRRERFIGKWNPPMYRTQFVEQPVLKARGKDYNPETYDFMSIQDQIHYNGFAGFLDGEFEKRAQGLPTTLHFPNRKSSED